MSVSVMLRPQGKSEMAVGNILGSNIFNVLFILETSALVAPLIVDQQLIRLDVPVMILASVVMVVMCAVGLISRWHYSAEQFSHGLADSPVWLGFD